MPVFFLLSPGVNPDADVKVLGNGLGKTEDEGKFIRVSLGQGQDVVAEKALDQMYIEGGWVMLANIELVAGWLPKLEKKLEALEEGAHPEFRVFLSALPQKCVPVPILQKSIKLTNEPPSGLKANLLRAYLAFDASVWENSSKQARPAPTPTQAPSRPLALLHTLRLALPLPNPPPPPHTDPDPNPPTLTRPSSRRSSSRSASSTASCASGASSGRRAGTAATRSTRATWSRA